MRDRLAAVGERLARAPFWLVQVSVVSAFVITGSISRLAGLLLAAFATGGLTFAAIIRRKRGDGDPLNPSVGSDNRR